MTSSTFGPTLSRRRRRYLAAAAVSLALCGISTPAGAVLPTWTALIPSANGGTPVGAVHEDGSTFVLLEHDESVWDELGDCRLAMVGPSGVVTWARTIATGDFVDCIDIASDGSSLYVIFNAHGTVDGVPGTDGSSTYLRRLTFDGEQSWSRSISTVPAHVASAITASTDGIYVSGHVSLDPDLGSDAFVRAYDVEGAVRWTRTDRTGDEGYGRAASDAVGVYLIGYDAAGTGSIVRYGADGSLTFRTVFPAPPYTSIQDLAVSDRKLIVVGCTAGVFPGEHLIGGDDAFIATVRSASGATVRVRQFGTERADVAGSIAVGPSGIYVAGTTNGAFPRFQHLRPDNDAFIRAFGVDGARRWTRQFGTTSPDGAVAAGADASGVVVTGWSYGFGGASVDDPATFVRRFEPA